MLNSISERSVEAFILRVYKEKNQQGFVKAFSEEAESLHGGFGKVERLLKLLYVRKLYLWPRFRLEIANALEIVQPEVEEITQKLTPHMKAIQSALLVAMNTCLTELKKSIPHLDNVLSNAAMDGSSSSVKQTGGADTSSLSYASGSAYTLENSLFQSFDLQLRSQLETEWHRISSRAKQIINDISVLRKLLDYLIRYDAFSFYYLLLKIKTSSIDQSSPSLWLTSEAADHIFKRAKDRVYEYISVKSSQRDRRNHLYSTEGTPR